MSSLSCREPDTDSGKTGAQDSQQNTEDMGVTRSTGPCGGGPQVEWVSVAVPEFMIVCAPDQCCHYTTEQGLVYEDS